LPPPQGTLTPGATYSIPQTRELSGLERGALGAAALIGRNPLLAVPAIRGEVTEGATTIREPTSEQLAERVADEARTNGVSGIGERFEKLSRRYGPEAAGEIVNRGLDLARSKVQETLAKRIDEQQKQMVLEDRQVRMARLREALRSGRPTEQAADQEAIIQQEILSGKAERWSEDERRRKTEFLIQRQNMNPINQIILRSMGGMGATPGPAPAGKTVTDSDVNAAAQTLRDSLGREPTVPEIRSALEAQGFALP
jgi:hypothetical protein